MRRYEVVFVLAPDLANDILEETIKTFQDVAEEMGAKVLGIDKWDKRPLAFPVKNYKEGTYVFMDLEEDAAEAASELERRFKVSESVIRYLTIRSDQQHKRVKKTLAKRARRSADSGPETPQPEAVKEDSPTAPEDAEAPSTD